MDLFDVAKITARRWFVFIPIVAIAAFFAYQAYTDVKPVYYTSASIGLVSPSIKDVPQPTVENPNTYVVSNGLLDSGGTSLLANLLAIGLKDGAIRTQVTAAGGSGAYSSEVFSLATGGQLPIVVVSSSGSSADRVANTVSLVLSQAQNVIRDVQANAGVPADRMVSAFPTSSIPPPTGGLPGRTRTTITILLAGLAIAVVMSVLCDALLKGALARRRPKVSAEAVKPVDDLPEQQPQNGSRHRESNGNGYLQKDLLDQNDNRR